MIENKFFFNSIINFYLQAIRKLCDVFKYSLIIFTLKNLFCK